MNITYPTCADAQYKIAVLREELRRVDTRIAHYRLCLSRFAQNEYYVEILFAGERAAASLGTDYADAGAVFERLVCGTVTPCTLFDILQDIKNADSPLQI